MPAKIAVRNVAKGYATDQGILPVIDNIDFEVRAGEFVAIVGPSGCGKSTLLHMLAGFDQPDRGTVMVDGLPGNKPTAKGILIPQQGSVFPWLTVQQNLMFGLKDCPMEEKVRLATHYAQIVGLKGFEKSYPFELSGGMLKRAEIARALVVKPEILYMDEPFSALDALMKLHMRKELRRILEEERHTVVLITHDVEEALDLADRILVLSARPTRIQAEYDVPFRQPRKLSSPELQELKEAVLRELGV